MTQFRRQHFFMLAAAYLMAATLLTARATTVSFVPVADSYIRQLTPDAVGGGETTLVAGELGDTASREVRRAMMRFDLASAIPVGAVVNSVMVQVTVVRSPLEPANSNFDLRRLLQAWDEAEVSWTSRSAGLPWQVPGAIGSEDVAAIASSSIFVLEPSSLTYVFSSTPNLVADVQTWVNDPETNFGWLLLSENETTLKTARRFGAREDAHNSPMLVVDYFIPLLAITNQPISQLATVGDTVTFSVGVSGVPPLFYQWFKDGNQLLGETNASLFLNSVKTNQAGAYSVLVSNATASVTSQSAMLTLRHPEVTIISPTNEANFAAHADVLLAAAASEPGHAIVLVQFLLDTNSAPLVPTFTNSLYSFSLTNAQSGRHRFTAIAVDDLGVTGEASVNFTVGQPVVRILSPINGEDIPIRTPVTFVAEASEAGETIAQVEFFLNSNSVGVVTSSPYSLVQSNVASGTNHLFAQAMDSHGVIGQSLPIEFIVGRPVVAITAPSNNAKFASGADVLFSAVVTGTEGIVTQLQFFSFGTNLLNTVTGGELSVLHSHLGPGSYLLTARATDNRGLSGNSSGVPFFVLPPPVVTLTSPMSGSRFLLGTNITVSAGVVPGDLPLNIFASGPVSGDGPPPLVQIGATVAAPFQISWAPTVPGNYDLFAIATDETGQAGQSTNIRVLVYVSELIPPTLTITGGPNDFARVTNSPILVTGTASDNIGLDRIDFQVFSGPFLSELFGSGTAEGTSSWQAQVPLAPGKNAVVFKSIDLAQNSSATITRYFTYAAKGMLQITNSGIGRVTPNLNGRNLDLGKVYTVTARPGKGQIFAGWQQVGPTFKVVPGATNPRLSFEMESGLILTAFFASNAFPAAAGTYTGLILNTNSARLETSGLFTLQLAKSGAFSGKSIIQGIAYSFHGNLDIYGHSRLLLPKTSSITLEFFIPLFDSIDTLFGTVTFSGNGLTMSSALNAFRNVSNSKNPQVVKHSLMLLDTVSETPQSVATLEVAVNPSGKVQIKGVTGSQKFSMSTAISKDDSSLPLYVPLSKKAQALIGTLYLPKNPPGNSIFDLQADADEPILLQPSP